MYESPIRKVKGKFPSVVMQEMEDGTMKAVVSCGIDVDKKELIRALQYDRDQYDKGYRDGYEDRRKEVDCEKREVLMQKLMIEMSDVDFGAVLNCAVRYAIGRKTYMPHLVMDFIRPLLPHLSEKTLCCFAKDIEEAEREDCLGDPNIDAPAWHDFLGAVQKEKK